MLNLQLARVGDLLTLGEESHMKIWLDGKLVDESEAKVSVFDHGLLYGDGVFEGIRIYNGRIFRLEEHIHRLFDSAKAIILTMPWTQEEVCKFTCRNGGGKRPDRRLHPPGGDPRGRGARV